MKLTTALFKGPGRRPQMEPVPFQEILPLKLKGSVSGKGDKTSKASCVQEMAVMLACLKQNEFDQAMCSSEIKIFQDCVKEYDEKKKLKDTQEKLGILTPGERNLSHKQINQLLRRFPPLS
ncbi:coiled-coil-helix-coiled-coil-helix domain-containing protein 1 [Schistocerca americana]|uniref:coiled-coil-helix-coiled-coil-helix domain-containing protein 1 n=1 Tax=Schistocerca americana TaxID=7009 RepID=UPI001F4F5967|nr:coiled-coil-helix-coiled-coil-helix domain-containing protein 1 [Schistocerca americana]XP_046979824.1 coiled-coil-helix-coiled-coil-helix domain-containing protein 1 [Schistocerca americana]XP_046979834.1 coiled-coil-helix-coiled-coil-helix domain-containing protein 1 [Schistocerca americana]XP_047113972.1 coiled-coil-helix-coiled-coil-helix domain-containing protein 1 [Schistocerca piceifrons]XP_047113973.1 coiled-coil-helix-coiled-coil-helix domain-containing protein 1 [Schistocerca picei